MKHLEAWQRYEIAARLEAGYTKKQVAEFLHVHPSTITREIQRNGYSRYRVYRPKIAQERAEYRWRCRKLPRKRHGFLSPDAVFSRMTGLDAGKFV